MRRVTHKSPLIERLFDRIAVDENGCWIYTKGTNSSGYGSISDQHKAMLTHRLVWEMTHGPVPEGLELDHLCRVRACCNPDHLEPVTHQVNMRRSVAPCGINAAKTECDYGHPFTEENTKIRKGGKERECFTCYKRRRREYRARLRTRQAAA